jgi:hypothetical protein
MTSSRTLHTPTMNHSPTKRHAPKSLPQKPRQTTTQRHITRLSSGLASVASRHPAEPDVNGLEQGLRVSNLSSLTAAAVIILARKDPAQAVHSVGNVAGSAASLLRGDALASSTKSSASKTRADETCWRELPRTRLVRHFHASMGSAGSSRERELCDDSFKSAKEASAACLRSPWCGGVQLHGGQYCGSRGWLFFGLRSERVELWKRSTGAPLLGGYVNET